MEKFQSSVDKETLLKSFRENNSFLQRLKDQKVWEFSAFSWIDREQWKNEKKIIFNLEL